MQVYYGTKRITAQPMSRLEYNNYRGWELPADEVSKAADAGYLVEYAGDDSNHPNHKGYISWSPASQFDSAYQPLNRLDFGHALAAMKDGERVLRSGWNGKGMWLVIVGAGDHPYELDIDYIVRDDSDDAPIDGLKLLPWIGMRTADGSFVPWLASQTDMLASDWQVFE